MGKVVFADGKTVYLEQVMEYLNKRHPDLHPQERYFLLELVRRGKFGNSFASFDQLGISIGCSKNSAENLAKRLRKAGLLEWKSGSIKGSRRLANEYSLNNLLSELNKSHQGKVIKDGERYCPNIREGNPNFYDKNHPNNCTGTQGSHPENWIGPSQILGTNNNIKRDINNKAAKELEERTGQQPKRFSDFMALQKWVEGREVLKGVAEVCLKDFYYKMSEKDWLYRGQLIANMENLILAWNKQYKPIENQDNEECWVCPGDSLRAEDALRKRLIEKFGDGTSD